MRIAKRSYRNPVYRGDYPDPSVIRVGEHEFWAVTTSSAWAPEFPLLQSRDLIHWSIVGAVFGEPPAWARGSFLAPELSFYNGRYMLLYVAQHKGGYLTVACATADRPDGPYTDHGPLEGVPPGSSDPTAARDRDGRCYLIFKTRTALSIAPLSGDGLRLIGEPQPILSNDAAWEGDIVEAPCVIQRDGWFYLLYSANAAFGKHCKAAVGVARAHSLYGPWIKSPANPIVPGNESWRCPGHGSIVETADGRTFYLYHAYSREDSIYVGRQMLLDEVFWSDGWPVVNHGAGPSTVAPLPFARTRKSPPQKEMWQWPEESRPRVQFGTGLRRQMIALGGRNGGFDGDVLRSIIARPAGASEYIAETGVDLQSLVPGVQASLVAYGDAQNAVGAGVRDDRIIIFRRVRGAHTIVAETPIDGHHVVRIRMYVVEGRVYRFTYSYDGRSWKSAGPLVRAPHITRFDRGIRIALSVGGIPNASARFKWFIVTRPG